MPTSPCPFWVAATPWIHAIQMNRTARQHGQHAGWFESSRTDANFDTNRWWTIVYSRHMWRVNGISEFLWEKKVENCSRRLKKVKNGGVWANRPEKLVSSVVEMHCGNRGAHKPLEHNNLVSPSNLYSPKSLQRAWSEWPCGTSHPTFFYFVVTKIKTKS